MRPCILGLGQWLPDEARSNSAWPADFAGRSRSSSDRELVDVPDSRSPEDAVAMRHFAEEASDPFVGTSLRRIAPPGVTSAEAETIAAIAALRDAGIPASSVGAVFSHSAVPDRLMPASATAVAHGIGAPPGVLALGVDAACASSVAHLGLASSLVSSGQVRYALVTQSHLLTRTFPMGHPASPNVGDAATAMVVGYSSDSSLPLILETVFRTDGEYYPAVTWTRGRGSDTPWWTAGPGFCMGSQDGAMAQHLIRSTVRMACDTIRDLFSEAGSPVDFGVLLSVQPRSWVPGAICEALGVAASAPCTFSEFAHLGACGPVVNLIRARELGLLSRGTPCVMYAQGAGFVRAASLIHC